MQQPRITFPDKQTALLPPGTNDLIRKVAIERGQKPAEVIRQAILKDISSEVQVRLRMSNMFSEPRRRHVVDRQPLRNTMTTRATRPDVWILITEFSSKLLELIGNAGPGYRRLSVSRRWASAVQRN